MRTARQLPYCWRRALLWHACIQRDQLVRAQTRLLSTTASSCSSAEAEQQQQQPPAAEPLIDDAVVMGTLRHFVNPKLRVQMLPGRGRGIITTAPLSAGDLVMCTQPLACVLGPRDEMPDPSQLLDPLRQLRDAAFAAGSTAGSTESSTTGSTAGSTSGPAPGQVHAMRAHPGLVRAWLGAMYKGTAPGGSFASGPHGTPHAAMDAHAIDWLLHAPLVGPAAAAVAAELQASCTDQVTDDDLESLVSHTAFGDAFEDLPILDCRQQAVQDDRSESQGATASEAGSCGSSETSHVGVWPHFSLLNHSCLPACVHYVTGAAMVVRAARDVVAGEELTVSYLGREEFSPAPVRQQLLQERYGFHCTCPRCTLEAGLEPSTSALLRDLHSATTTRLAPTLTEAATAGDYETLAKMSEELVNRSKQLHAALASFLAQATGLQQTPTTPTPISQLPSQQSPAHGSGFQSHANRADGALTDVPLTLGHVAAAAVAPGGEKARQEEAGAKQQELVVSLGGPEAAVLCVEAAVYDFLELLQQHAQLMSAYEEVQQAEAEEGGQTAAGQSQAGGDPLAALQLCMQVLHATSRGSELHVFQAARLLDLALADAGTQMLGEEAAAGAAAGAEEALVARYGQCSQEVMRQLARAAVARSQEFIV